MTPLPDMPAEVAAAFDAFPEALRPSLRDMRRMIFETAARIDEVGPLTETLKWGEPAYLTEKTGAGSTVRLGVSRRSPDRCALFVNCRTSLVDGFRARFPELETEGDRAVLADPARPLPDALAACIAEALTYHAAKRRKRTA